MLDLATNLRTRRLLLELTQKELATRAGVSQQLIHALEAGTIRSTKALSDIARALSCAVTELEPKKSSGTAADSHAQNEIPQGLLPILGATELNHGAIAVAGTPIDFVSRPFPLLNIRGGYGILVASNTMFPEFEPGDYVLVNPHAPPVPLMSYVFYSESAEGTVGRIERLVSSNVDSWTVKCWNPVEPGGETSILPRDTWPKCHRIVGRYNRR